MSDRDKYLEAYYQNEYDANKHMTYALLFSALILALVWIGYLTDFFDVTRSTLILTNIAIPICLVLLITPFFWYRIGKRGNRPGFKYFVLFSFIVVIAFLNIVMPKHAIIGWALTIVITNHYYNPKVGRIVFFVSLVLMLLCIYGGMFLGEYDSNLLAGELEGATGLIHHYSDSTLSWPDSAYGRYQYLKYLLSININRYLTAFVFYYLARAALISILFFISNSLNKRTYKLLIDEIKVNTDQQTAATELNIAKDIQLASLPRETLTNEDIEIVAELKPAKEVGGDFYDYFMLDEEHVAIVIGDVSGKGIPAAMFMMKAITCFQNYVNLNKSPSQILSEVNKTLYEGNSNLMFVTCFLAIINTKTGVMKFANAGHNPPIVGQNRHFHYLECKPGFLLGGMPQSYAVDEEYQLQKGDSITIYTDGITEAHNAYGELYGEERFLSLFNHRDYSCIIETHHDLKDDLIKFRGKAEQFDDITILTLKYHGDKYLYEEKMFDAKKENIPQMLSFINGFIKNEKFDDTFVNSFSIVGDEMLSNIIKYGYKDDEGEIFLRILCNKDQEELVLTIIDQGIPFNPFTFDNKPIEGDASKVKEGGLGILIVKNLMSEYAYDRINNKNIITLKKKK